MVVMEGAEVGDGDRWKLRPRGKHEKNHQRTYPETRAPMPSLLRTAEADIPAFGIDTMMNRVAMAVAIWSYAWSIERLSPKKKKEEKVGGGQVLITTRPTSQAKLFWESHNKGLRGAVQ